MNYSVRLLFVIVGAMATVVFASSRADAVTLMRVDGETPIPRLQRTVDRWPVPTRPGAVRVIYGADKTRYTDDRVIHVGVGQKLTEKDLAHELGHDYENIVTDAGFTLWSHWTGETMTRWQFAFDPRATTITDSSLRLMAQERFADWYQICAMRGRGSSSAVVTSYYGLHVSRSAMRASCQRSWRLPTL